ncbi:MAG: benzoate-CoA ligase family protein [Alphaproteobacteria bacterium]|nr:benzoate-CoA ligase family protein [Alphaproteobacteria bacterium]MDX5369578.1 benzoate-CoA ligase family protein [Alphaproteobacteria bacterium]MDX5464232.1 benzoate-CoA ligase family protein [Alphaproteobacteria bacterium]
MASTDSTSGPLYNAADDLIGRNLAAGRGNKAAFDDGRRVLSFSDLDRDTRRLACALSGLGLQHGDRVMLLLHDTVDFPVCFLGALRGGFVPVPVNVRATGADIAYMLTDSGARALICDASLWLTAAPAAADLEHRIVTGAGAAVPGALSLDALVASGDPAFPTAATRGGEVGFWLYTSGTTGRPKGVMHRHQSLARTADLFAIGTLGIGADDVLFSAPKMFFAYGLGNSLTFALATGATALLDPERPDPARIGALLSGRRPTVFFAVPTLYAMMLAQGVLPCAGAHALRFCVSAGEALPAALHARVGARLGVEVLDGLGSTEMLQTFLSNRPGDVRPGTSGKPVAGYRLRLLDEQGQPIEDADRIGTLEVAGPSSAAGYWGDEPRTRATFRGAWTRTGDAYCRDGEGYYIHCGRIDDMMKVGGIYVSPQEVETVLAAHPGVAEVAVAGWRDADGLEKPKAFVVPADPAAAGPALAAELQAMAREQLSPYKYPRWVEFVQAIPRTVTGKVQRYRLRQAQPAE